MNETRTLPHDVPKAESGTYDEVVPDRESGSLVSSGVVQVVRLTSKGGLDVVYHRFSDGGNIWGGYGERI